LELEWTVVSIHPIHPVRPRDPVHSSWSGRLIIQMRNIGELCGRVLIQSIGNRIQIPHISMTHSPLLLHRRPRGSTFLLAPIPSPHFRPVIECTIGSSQT